MRKKVLGAAATLLAASLPGTSFALGLGDIQLKSSLNAPLDAEIDLVGATAEELAGLKVQLASRDTFARYGIDYPAFLSGISVRTRAVNGRTVVQLHSAAPITEPFVTVLVEANYGRGRQVREYSVLLDPPVFTAPASAAPAAVAAPVTGSGERSGSVSRPATQPAPASPAAAPAAAAAPRGPAPAAEGGSYRVRGGDTLSRIATNLAGTADRRRAMVAIYRANPGAFDGNMNQLRSGAVLRLPDAAALAAVDPAEAAAEIRRQSSVWQGGAPAEPSRPAPVANQLKLVPPTEAKAPAAAPATAAPGTSQPAASSTQATQQLQQRLNELEAQLAQARRELEQQRSAAPAKSPAAPAAAPEAAAAPQAAAPAAGPAGVPVPAATPAPAPAPSKKAVPPAKPQAPDAGLVGLLKTLWYVPAGLLALVAALFGLRVLRRRREDAIDLSSALEAAAGEAADAYAATDVRTGTGLRGDDALSRTQPIRAPNAGGQDSSFVVEESKHSPGDTTTPRKLDVSEFGLPPSTGTTTTSLPVVKAGSDQSDPIAEADFHMAYGLYDQAADLIRLAIQRDPARRDLQLKLLEVFFVWGNKPEFVTLATELARTRDQGQAGEWDKILIMGRQLAPEASVFDSAQAKPATVAVDHNLEGGQNHVDLDLLPAGGEQDMSALDFDLGTRTTPSVSAAASGGQDGDTRLMPMEARLGKIAAGAPDKTQELAAFDDMGLDLGTLNTAHVAALEDSQLEKALGLDDSTSIMQGLGDRTVRVPSPDLSAIPGSDVPPGSSGEWQLLDANAETLGAADAQSGGTSILMKLPDQSLDHATALLPRLDSEEPGSTQQLEPPSLSEIGTKLDLARAYIDMGDPEGARSILEEVLAEGNDLQKQEAQRLLDAIPG